MYYYLIHNHKILKLDYWSENITIHETCEDIFDGMRLFVMPTVQLAPPSFPKGHFYLWDR